MSHTRRLRMSRKSRGVNVFPGSMIVFVLERAVQRDRHREPDAHRVPVVAGRKARQGDGNVAKEMPVVAVAPQKGAAARQRVSHLRRPYQTLERPELVLPRQAARKGPPKDHLKPR